VTYSVDLIGTKFVQGSQIYGTELLVFQLGIPLTSTSVDFNSVIKE
jgi:hypothetical protein